MSIYGEHKCPECGLAMSFMVDNGMILRIPSQEEEDKCRREILAYDFEVPVRGVPEKESPPGTTAKLEKESEKILDRWASKESSFRKLTRDLWVWLNTHTHGKEMMKKERKSSFIQGGLSDRTAAEIRDKINLTYTYPTNHLPDPTIDALSLETCFLAAKDLERVECPRTGNIRDGDLKYAGTCGGYQCTHHTCAGASCSHCGGTGRCPEKAAGKK